MTNPEANLAKVAKEETLRQTIIFLFGIAAVVTTAAAANSVDDWRTVKMGTALVVKRVCQREADRWQKWADDAASYYNREKA
jgi:hypothetical protein